MARRTKITPPKVDDPELDTLGPAMLALTEQQRRFVVAYTVSGHEGATAAARAAGYSDTKDGAKVRAFGLLRNPKVAEAIKEWTTTALAGRGAFIGLRALEAIALDPKHKDRFKAGATLMAVAGFAGKTEHEVRVTDARTDRQLIASIIEMARSNGMDPSKVLGAPIIEADFEEVENA